MCDNIAERLLSSCWRHLESESPLGSLAPFTGEESRSSTRCLWMIITNRIRVIGS
jgi:hypothetical protein